MNVTTLTGRVGKDPEIIEFSDSGNRQAVLSIATKRRTGRRKGEDQTTDWHRVKITDSDTVSNYVEPYIHKGALVSITGELTYEPNRSSQDPANKSKFAQIVVSDPRGIIIHARSSGHGGEYRGDETVESAEVPPVE